MNGGIGRHSKGKDWKACRNAGNGKGSEGRPVRGVASGDDLSLPIHQGLSKPHTHPSRSMTPSMTFATWYGRSM